jgi:type IV pilus assembly protein PilY1
MTVDVDLDYRVDVIYVGTTHRTSSGIPEFTGKLYRLTTGGCSSLCTRARDTWGIDDSGNRVPTVLLKTFGSLSARMGPVTAAPNASIDDANAIWVYWGTGHFYGDGDQSNTDTQHFFGVKDPVVTGGCTQTNLLNCEQNDLVDVSSAVVCTICVDIGIDAVEGVAGVTDFDGLQSLVESKEGWFTTLPTLGERSLSRATVLGGSVVFTTFSPDTGNVCNSKGSGRLYGLFYLTGSAYTESMLGTETVGLNTNLSRFVDLGAGLPSQVSVHVGRNGTAENGTIGSATGCSGRVTFYDGRNSAVDGTCGKPALAFWSRLISWRDL